MGFNLDFLDENLWKPAGKGLSEADRFMDREMPFDSGWGFPAALIASYFAAPYVGSALGAGEGAGAVGGAAEGGSAVGGGSGMLDAFGGSAGSFGGDLFQMGGSSSAIDPSMLTSADTAALDKLALQNGVSQGEPSWFDNLLGNNEQGLYDNFNVTNPDGSSKSSFGKEFGKQLMQSKPGSSMGQNMPTSYNEPPVQRQSNVPQFAPAAPIQNEKSDIAKLAALLRKKDQ